MTDKFLVERVSAQESALEREEEETGERVESLNAQMLELQSKLAEELNRLSRIRKTRKKAKERGEELFRRGMIEEDAAVAAEQSFEQVAVSHPGPSSVSDGLASFEQVDLGEIDPVLFGLLDPDGSYLPLSAHSPSSR